VASTKKVYSLSANFTADVIFFITVYILSASESILNCPWRWSPWPLSEFGLCYSFYSFLSAHCIACKHIICSVRYHHVFCILLLLMLSSRWQKYLEWKMWCRNTQQSKNQWSCHNLAGHNFLLHAVYSHFPRCFHMKEICLSLMCYRTYCNAASAVSEIWVIWFDDTYL